MFEKFKIGIEIETSGNTPTEVLYALKKRQDILDLGWEFVVDRSIKPHNGIDGCEAVSPVMKLGEIEQIAKITEFLLGIRSVVNKYCAVHVHISNEDLKNPQVLKRLQQFWGNNQRQIYELLGIKYTKRYAGLLPNSYIGWLNECDENITMEQLREGYYKYLANGVEPLKDEPPKRSRARRYGLNLHCFFHSVESYRNIEFRLFNATLDYNEIKRNIVFCLNVCQMAIDNSFNFDKLRTI